MTEKPEPDQDLDDDEAPDLSIFGRAFSVGTGNTPRLPEIGFTKRRLPGETDRGWIEPKKARQ